MSLPGDSIDDDDILIPDEHGELINLGEQSLAAQKGVGYFFEDNDDDDKDDDAPASAWLIEQLGFDPDKE